MEYTLYIITIMDVKCELIKGDVCYLNSLKLKYSLRLSLVTELHLFINCSVETFTNRRLNVCR